MNNPEYVKIGNEKYKINTDFRIAIECDTIARNENIGEYEKILAIIYKLFGNKGLNSVDSYAKLIELGQKYLRLGQDIEFTDEEPDMDFNQDKNLIASSFKYDYGYNPYEMEYLHWYDFYNDMSNLSNSEFGNCCVLSRIRNLRTYDVTKISDLKEREKVIKSQERVALKKTRKEKELTKEEEESIERFNKLMKGE